MHLQCDNPFPRDTRRTQKWWYLQFELWHMGIDVERVLGQHYNSRLYSTFRSICVCPMRVSLIYHFKEFNHLRKTEAYIWLFTVISVCVSKLYDELDQVRLLRAKKQVEIKLDALSKIEPTRNIWKDQRIERGCCAIWNEWLNSTDDWI